MNCKAPAAVPLTLPIAHWRPRRLQVPSRNSIHEPYSALRALPAQSC